MCTFLQLRLAFRIKREYHKSGWFSIPSEGFINKKFAHRKVHIYEIVQRRGLKMKSKLRTLAIGFLAGGILISSASATSFPDVDQDANYAEAVEYVSEQGFIVGDSSGKFNPEQAVTRAQMATIVCRVIGETSNVEKTFKFADVPENYWANSNIKRASDLGIISGYGNGNFGPSDNVTYEQCITMIIRALGGGELAAQYGGYPNGFISVAEQHGFLENIKAQKGEPLSRGDIAILLFNCAGFSFLE